MSRRINWFMVTAHALVLVFCAACWWLMYLLAVAGLALMLSGCTLTIHDSTDVQVLVIDSIVSPEVTGVGKESKP